MNNIPLKFQWIMEQKTPKLVVFAATTYGTIERLPDGSDNPMLLRWANVTKQKDYTRTSIPWCGLAMAYWCTMVGWPVPAFPLAARNWLNVGVPVEVAMYGDILIFKRAGGHHVGIYVGEDKDFYYVLGGNQGDKVCILRISKKRCIGIRRPPYKVQPSNVRRVFLKDGAPISKNEA